MACALQVIKQYHDPSRSGKGYYRKSYITQLDGEYLRNCKHQEILIQLSIVISIVTFVSDLKFSIEKIYQEKIQLAQCNIQVEEGFSKVLLFEKQLLKDYKDLIKREAHLSSTIGRLYKALIQRQNCKNTFHSNKIISSSQKYLNQFNSFLQSKLMKCCSYRQKNPVSSDQSKLISHYNEMSEEQDQYYEINSGTYEPYLQDLKRFLTEDNYDITLYNYLKNIVYRWVLGHYKEEVKNQLNLLGSTQNYPVELLKRKQMAKEEDQDKKLRKQKLKANELNSFTGSHQLVDRKSSEQANQKQDSLLLQLHDQQSKINIHSLIHAPLVNVVDLQKICCANFFYDFSTIEASKYNVHPQLTANIIIMRDEKQKQEKKLKDNANQNSQNSNANQKAKNSPVPTTPPPHPVSQAVCALLNNQGGYILIGLEKDREFYKPASQSESEKLLIESQYYSLIKKSFPKCWEDEKFRSMIKVNYIPIVQRSRPRTGKQNLWQLQEPNQIKFICRIKVQPKDEYQRMFYSIGGQKNEKGSVEGKSFAYDIVKQDLNIRQLTGQEIYKKMKQIQESFGTFNISGKKEFYKSLNKNQFKITSHCDQKCKNVDQRFINLMLSCMLRASVGFHILIVNRQSNIQQKNLVITKIRIAFNYIIQLYQKLDAKANLVSKNIKQLRLHVIIDTINMLGRLIKQYNLRINKQSKDEQHVISACQQQKFLQNQCNSKIRHLLRKTNIQSRKQLIRLTQLFQNHQFTLKIYPPCCKQIIIYNLLNQQLPGWLQQLSSLFVRHSQVCGLINSIVAKFYAQIDLLKLEKHEKMLLIEWIVFNKPLGKRETELQRILFHKITFSLEQFQIMQQLSNPNLLQSRGGFHEEITHYLGIIIFFKGLLGNQLKQDESKKQIKNQSKKCWHAEDYVIEQATVSQAGLYQVLVREQQRQAGLTQETRRNQDHSLILIRQEDQIVGLIESIKQQNKSQINIFKLITLQKENKVQYKLYDKISLQEINQQLKKYENKRPRTKSLPALQKNGGNLYLKQLQNKRSRSRSRSRSRTKSQKTIHNNSSNNSFFCQQSLSNPSEYSKHDQMTTYQNRMNRPYCIYPAGFNHNQLYFQRYGRQPPYDVIYNNINGQWYYWAQGQLRKNQYQPQRYQQTIDRLINRITVKTIRQE